MNFYMGLSTLKTISALGFAATLSFSQVTNASVSCAEKLGAQPTHFSVNPTKGKIKISDELGALFIQTGASQRNSTTGNRTEFKRTVTVEDFNQSTQKLSKTFVLTPRDTVKPGTKNVTVTNYINVLKFDYNGQELGVKIRFRKYGTIKEGLQNTPENVQIIPEMSDVSFLEFKIDHPDFENSVLKPRGVVQDADIALIGTDKFLKNFEQILKRAIDKNSKSAASIETMTMMLNVLKRLHETSVPLNLDSRTIYERTSYALGVSNVQTNKNYEIQITQDEGILLYSYPHNKTVDAYKSVKPLTVVELKIPVEMVDKETKGFKQEMLDAIPQLKAVQGFLNDLTTAQAPGYEANKGKQSLIRGLLEAKE